MDYLIFHGWEDTPFAIRWGHYNGTTIRRNSTARQSQCQSQGMLFGGFDSEQDGLSSVTIAYKLEDDYTIAGFPAWWMSRIVLIRERVDESEIITDVAVYDSPSKSSNEEELPTPQVTPREGDILRWEEMIRNICRIA